MDSKEDLIKRAAQIIRISTESAAENFRYIEEIDAYHTYSSVRGGGAVIIKSKDDFLFATSLVTLEMHIEAFRNGKRTNPKVLEKQNSSKMQNY